MKKILFIFTSLLFASILGVAVGTAAEIPAAIPFGISMGASLGSMFMKPSSPLAFFNFANLEWADGIENMGGLQVNWYYAPIADIDNFPELPSNPSTPEEEVTLESTTGFTFKTGKMFLKGYSTQETSEVKDEPQGEPDGQSFKHSADIFYPGNTAAAMAFAKHVNNSNMVFLFKETNGTVRVIGSRAFPAKCRPAFTTGKATADRKGMTMEIYSYGSTPACLYTGAILLEAAP